MRCLTVKMSPSGTCPMMTVSIQSNNYGDQIILFHFEHPNGITEVLHSVLREEGEHVSDKTILQWANNIPMPELQTEPIFSNVGGL